MLHVFEDCLLKYDFFRIKTFVDQVIQNITVFFFSFNERILFIQRNHKLSLFNDFSHNPPA